jgi:predicted DNA-binding transcriptional regulator YafY
MKLKNKNVATRFITILQYLNKGLILNVEALSQEFSISIRQVQNDIKLLGTFFELESLGHQNYKLKNPYILVALDNKVTQIALSVLKSLQHSALPQMNTLVDQLLPETSEYHKMFHFQIDYEKIDDITLFYKVLESISLQKSIHFKYTKKDNSSKIVFVHPYKIANFSNYWYLLAYDVKDSRLKSYHINSFSDLKIDEENFINSIKVEKEIEMFCKNADSPWYSSERYTVEIKVKGESRHYIERNLPHNLKFLKSSSEYNHYECHYYDDKRELFIFLKQWLPDITITNNPQLQKEFSQLIQSYFQ